MGMRLNDDRWAKFLDDDPELDEEGDQARTEASQLKMQANAFSDQAERMPEGRPRSERLREAIGMYNRADATLMDLAQGRRLPPNDRDSVLQCRLNGACLSLKIGDEAAVEHCLKAASDLDADNPHAALFQARLASIRGKRDLAEKWVERARSWAKHRGEEHLLEKASDFLQPLKEGAPASKEEDARTRTLPNPALWVQQGVAFIKQRRLTEAEDLLKRAMHCMDEEKHGGPVERLEARAPRALAFNTLEALSDVHASFGRWEEAVSCGQRAIDLIRETAFEAPFSTPEVHRREGLLCFSIGHVTLAAGDDPLPTWRRAVQALDEHGGDPGLAGKVLLKIGLHLTSSHSSDPRRCDDVEAIEEAVVCLENAGSRFSLARSRLSAEGLKTATFEKRHDDLVYHELEAQAKLAKLLYEICEHTSAGSVLDTSAALLDMVPTSVADLSREMAESWAELCGLWGLTADKLRRLPETERAILIQCRLLHDCGSKDSEMSALKALAVVRRQQRNHAGVDEALADVETLAPDEEKETMVKNVRRMLRDVAPEIDPTEIEKEKLAKEAAKAAEITGQTDNLSVRIRQQPLLSGAVLLGVLAVILGCVLSQYGPGDLL